MTLPLLLAALPCVSSTQGLEGAAALKTAGIERVCGDAELRGREKLPAPGIRPRAGRASPTRSPWVFANGWRFLRQPAGRYAYEAQAGKASLAAAEAFAYGADAIIPAEPADVLGLGQMLAFLAGLPASELPDVADLGVVDDGSPALAEPLNMLVRRNILFRIVKQPQPQFAVNVQLGSSQFPLSEAADPSALALKIRRQLGDERRSLRLFGSEVVIGRLSGDASRARLHLLNYGGRESFGLRVRVRGSFQQGESFASGQGRAKLEELSRVEDATEFSLPRLETYAVIDLLAR